MNSNNKPVCIVGAGWAGLAAAVELVKHGVPVRLFESAKTAGGRARDIKFANLTVDNGQHLLIGAYRAILETLSTAGVAEETVLLRQRISLSLYASQQNKVSLSAPALPAPLHLLFALLFSEGLTIRQRLAAMKLGLQLVKSPENIASETTVEQWLKKYGQDEALVTAVWEPLCLAIMNTPVNVASAQIFMRVLKDSFMHHRADSDLLFSRKNLTALFVDPCINYIQLHGGEVLLRQGVDEVVIENDTVAAVISAGNRVTTDNIIIATPPTRCHALLKDYPQLSTLNDKLAAFEYEPIATIYLQYPQQVRLPQPMIGMLGTHSQWIIDRASCGQPGLMAVVISSSGKHMDMDKASLAETVTHELATIFPDWPAPLSYEVVREKRATFQCRAAIEDIRPDNRTSIHGLWLAGDYTNTGYPATLEGAVRSGIRAARQLLKST